MTVELITAMLLIVVPIGFNLAFIELGRAFDYPNILREPPDTILRRFDAGGPGLVLRWHALLLAPWRCCRCRPARGRARRRAGPDRARRSSSGRSPRWSRRSASFAGRLPSRSWRVATWLRRRTGRRGDAADDRDRLRHAPPTARGRHRRAPRLSPDGPVDAARGGLDRVDGAVPAGSASSGCRSASPSSSARSSSSARTSATAGTWPASSCRSPTSPGRSGSSPSASRSIV